MRACDKRSTDDDDDDDMEDLDALASGLHRPPKAEHAKAASAAETSEYTTAPYRRSCHKQCSICPELPDICWVLRLASLSCFG